MKQWQSILVMIVVMVFVLTLSSCKKDEGNPAGPNNPIAELYGSGSVSFNTNSSIVGNYNISGAFNPTSYGSNGSGVWCWHDAGSNTAGIYGYIWRSSSDWDQVVISVYKSSGALTTGTYDFTEQEASVSIVKGASGMGSADGSRFVFDAGTLTITSITSTGMKGNFSGTGIGYSSDVMGTPIQVTNGSFDVTFGTASDAP